MGSACCGMCLSQGEPGELKIEGSLSKQPVPPSRSQALDTVSVEDYDEFEIWISAIERGKKNFFTCLDIKNKIAEAGSRFGAENKAQLQNGNQETIDHLYQLWFGSSAGEEVEDFTDRDEMCIRLRDMMEAEQNPFADCFECDALGKVCYENDGGLSHRLSMGEVSVDEIVRMSFKKKKNPFASMSQVSGSTEQIGYTAQI